MKATNTKDIASAFVPSDEAETHVFKALVTYDLDRLDIMLLDEAPNAENMAFIHTIDHLEKL